MRNKSRGVYKVALPARMHKIFVRAMFRTLVESSSTPLYATRFSNRRGRGGALLSACFSLVPRRDETFSPCAICRRQCALPRDSPAGLRTGVSLPLSYSLFLTLNSRLPQPRSIIFSHSSVPFVPSQLPSFLALARCFLCSSFLSCYHIPREYHAPSFGFVFVKRKIHLREKVSKKSM